MDLNHYYNMEQKKRIKIDDKVYTKNVTCFLVNGEWVPNTLVNLDNYTKKYNLRTKLTECYDINKNDFIFSSKPVCLYICGRSIWVCKSLIENNSEFIEDPNYDLDSDRYISIFDKRVYNKGKYKPSNKIYNISAYDVILPKYTKIPNILNFIDYTFGFELETNRGEIKKSYSDSLGFASLYDGSISGVEYVSNPMSYNNLHHLHKFLKIAKTATDIDKYCSLHIHIGNVPKGDKYLLSMYLLFQRLTDELNQLIVPYKKDVKFLFDKLQNTGKDHCKNLPKLPQKSVEEIYKLFKIDKLEKKNLSSYIQTTSKWNIDGRYYSVNFMNYICKDVNNTVEIRSLQSTYNFDYITTWLLINCSIINYAVKYPDIVVNSKVKIELDDCIDDYINNSKLASTLKENIVQLKNLFYNMYYLKGNSLTNLELVENEITNVIKPYDLYDVKHDYSTSLFCKFMNTKNNKSAKESVRVQEHPEDMSNIDESLYRVGSNNPVFGRIHTYTISSDGTPRSVLSFQSGSQGVLGLNSDELLDRTSSLQSFNLGDLPDPDGSQQVDQRVVDRVLPLSNIDSQRYNLATVTAAQIGLTISTFSNNYGNTHFGCKYRILFNRNVAETLEILNTSRVIHRVNLITSGSQVLEIEDENLRLFVTKLISNIKTAYNLRLPRVYSISPEYIFKDQEDNLWLLCRFPSGNRESIAVRVANYHPSSDDTNW